MCWVKGGASGFDLSIYHLQLKLCAKIMRRRVASFVGKRKIRFVVHQRCNGVMTVHVTCYSGLPLVGRGALLAIVAWIVRRRSYRLPYLYTNVSTTPLPALISLATCTQNCLSLRNLATAVFFDPYVHANVIRTRNQITLASVKDGWTYINSDLPRQLIDHYLLVL